MKGHTLIGRMTALILLAALLCICTAGCADRDERDVIVCSSFVIYDWVTNILGEDAQEWSIRLLGAKGADIHSYQPTVRDIAATAQCRVFIRNGGESETWAPKMTEAAKNSGMLELSLCDRLEEKLCAEAEHSGHSGHSHEGHAHDSHAHEYDEHIWLSFEYAKDSVILIARTLSEAKPERADVYSENARLYSEKISAVEKKYRELADSAKSKAAVLCDRDPFEYLWEFMGIECEAAFEGCSAESEAGFSVVSRLAEKIDETSAGYVLVCESSDGRIADAVISATKEKNASVLTLNSMQSAVIGDAGYIEMLESNLEVLRSALLPSAE